MALAEALTVSEKQFLTEVKNSEHFKLFKKALEYQYSLVCAMLVHAKPEDLPIQQGRLQGLLSAINVIENQQIEPEFSKVTPMRRPIPGK